MDRCRTKNVHTNRACHLVGLNRSLYYYHKVKPKNKEDQKILEHIKELREEHEVLGAKKLAKLMSTSEKKVNHKRVARLLRENNLTVKQKVKRHRSTNSVERLPLPVEAKKRTGIWSIDFMCSRKNNAFRFMLLNMVDITSKQSPGMVIERSFTSLDVTQSLEDAIKLYGKPEGLITDNGVEFTATNFRVWCKRNKIVHYLTNKASPAENCFVESFNSCVRREVLDINEFKNISELRESVRHWREFYNKHRPHGSLGYLSPEEYIRVQINRKQSV